MSDTISRQTRSAAVSGAAIMTLAGVAFAIVNVAVQWATMTAHASGPGVAFWQYLIGVALALPLIWRDFSLLKTTHPWLHALRIACAAAGVQAWVAGLSVVPIWQAVALSMTSPFFVVAGAALFLGERVTASRLAATVTGFVGAMIILAPWSETFTAYSLLPVLAAALWAATSLITKQLTRDESASSITVWLLLLLVPVNFVVWAGAGLHAPPVAAWMAIAIAGAATAASQYLLTYAYSRADATYLQPFDDLKLPLNILLGWVVFGFAPSLGFWPGAALIVGASIFLMTRER